IDGVGLKISKAGGLTHSRRHRDIGLAAGLSLSVQETVGSDIPFAAIAHLGATIPERNLRCLLDTRGMVSIHTAEFDAPIVDGGVMVPNKPGLGITVDEDLLGSPVAVWGD
ncbi:enolase C-terminal domain-like protein, partial [Acinetobacter baumannii]